MSATVTENETSFSSEILSEILDTLKIPGYNPESASVPMLSEGLLEVNENVSESIRALSAVAALVWNLDLGTSRLDKGKIQELIHSLDVMVNNQVNEVLHHEKFQELESTWRGITDLVSGTNFGANITINILDVSKEELRKDFEDNSVDFTASSLFRKVYINEYGQFGGCPFGTITGLYKFEHTPSDLAWLRTMGKIAQASQCPFISSVSPKFFGCDSVEELASIKDLEGLMNHPKYSAFNALRDSDEAAYLGLCLPSYVLRLPWHPVTNPCGSFNFEESTRGDESKKYLWGNAAILFTKNLVRSFETSGWCQHLRGPKGGGLVTGLPVHTFNLYGEEEIKPPVEFIIPDYRELEFANCGFIPLIYRKGSGEACFFSAQSVKRPQKFKNPEDSENAQLICNLPYIFSITRIAHYVKTIGRMNIGSTADASYIENILNRWISDYVTAVSNPDDITLRRYPFKAASIEVLDKPGRIGYFQCKIVVQPQIQMEGMDVKLQLRVEV